MSFFKYKFRAPHLGKYPMEQVKRVDKPTTRIDADKIKRVPLRAAFFTRPIFGDLGDKVKDERARFIGKSPISEAIGEVMQAMIPLQDGPVAEEKAPLTDDPAEMAKHMKSLAYFMDMDIVGICEIPEYAWYTHDGKGNPVEARHSHAIVCLIDQGYETMEGASGDDWISGTQSYRAYLRGAEVGNVIANYIRKLGYEARCQSAASGEVMQIPLMLLAGLGELSRIGELVLNPFIGPRSKTVIITTNLPMECDKPIDFGLQKFCDSCFKCARECPCNAISFGPKIMYNGYEIWKPDVENCAKYRITNPKGSACGRCMKTCPLNKVVTKDGPLMHRIASWLGINAMWLKPLMIPIAVWADDFMGNGTRVKSQKWWLDIENVDGKIVKARGVNERDIDVKKKWPKTNKVALYTPEDHPPGDSREPHPVDRKAAISKGDEALKPENSPANAP
jgi:reductive dehalogenase